jgi:hypothetical protein
MPVILTRPTAERLGDEAATKEQLLAMPQWCSDAAR